MVCNASPLVRVVVPLILLATLLPPTAQAQPSPALEGWPTFAGNMGRTGAVSNDLPLDDGRLNLRWKRFLGERIEVEMEPVVVGDLLYIGLMNGKLYALDRRTGSTVWVYETGMGLTNSPTVADINGRRMVFFGSTNGNIYGLDALTGEALWTYATGGPVMATPSVVKGAVYIGSLDGTFYALDAVSGAVRWQYATGAPIANTSAVGEATQSGRAGIFVANGANVAYAFSEDGALLWQQQMYGLFTKRTYAVYADGVVMFVTRKPGAEYSEPKEDMPDTLQRASCLRFDYADGSRQCVQPIDTYVYCDEWTYVPDGENVGQPLQCLSYQSAPRSGEEVLAAWADYYLKYPRRRPLYFFDARTGADLWQPDIDKTRFAPLYIPYWGLYMPVVDDQGLAYLPASGSGGDHALDHDIRLWRLDLRTGEYTQVATQAEFLLRFDEVGRPTLVGNRYYQTISEDIGYYDLATREANADVFGNGMGSHRMPLELSEVGGNQAVFGGLYRHFPRFGGSSPGGFGGGNDAASPLVVVGDEAYFTSWGYLYALTSERPQPLADHGALDLTGPPTTTLTRDEARAMLNAQVQAIVNNEQPLHPEARLWGWTGLDSSVSFWNHGETVRTLAETIPYLDVPVRQALEVYLKRAVQKYLLNPDYYEYRWACIDYDLDAIQDPCDRSGVEVGWFWSDPDLTSERLYALYRYALVTDDWESVTANWTFIRARFDELIQHWDEEAGLLLSPEWLSGNLDLTRQMGAMLAVREMAGRAGDSAARDAADAYLNRMLAARVYWGRYVRSLYDAGQLQRQNFERPENWGYDLLVSPLPAEGYLDRDNDYRQIRSLQRGGEGSFQVVFDDQGRLEYPYYLIGFHPIYPEFRQLIRDNLLDELSDYIAAIEILWPWWYMNDYGHGSIVLEIEEDSTSPLLASDLFQARAYIFNEPFEKLAPFLPWPYENYGHRDIFRLQNLVALLQAP